MRRWFVAIIALSVGVFGASMHSFGALPRWKRVGVPQVKTYELGGFTGVSNTLPGVVEVAQGRVFSVRGESSYAGLLEDLSVEVRDGVLVVGASEEVRRALSAMRIFPLFTLRVTLPRLTLLSLGGSGDLRVLTDVETDGISIGVAGSGEVRMLRLESSGRVSVALSGSGDVEMGGVVCGGAYVEVAGSGDVKLGDVRSAGDVQLRLNGSGDVVVGTIEGARADVRLCGSGDIKVRGLQARGRLEIDGRGSGDVSIGAVQSDRAAIGHVGSGEIALASVDAENVSAKLGSSGSILIGGGRSVRCEISLTGSGDIDLSKHRTRDATLEIMGSGDISMHVSDTVRMRGGSSSVTCSIEGGARVLMD